MPIVNIQNESIHYDDVGNGLPILLIHPPGMGRFVFEEQKSISNHFRLIIPDLVGQGDSTYHGGSEITIKRFCKDMIDLLDHLNIEKAVILGYSSGGTIAQQMVIDYPTRVKALIMSGGFPVVDNFILVNEHKLGIYAAKRSKKFLANILAVSHTKNKELRQKLKEHMYKSNGEVWSKFYLESLNFNCKDAIKGSNIPTLLIYGSLADPINTYAKFYKEHLPNVQIHVIKLSTHRLPAKRSKQVNDIIMDYLNKLE